MDIGIRSEDISIGSKAMLTTTTSDIGYSVYDGHRFCGPNCLDYKSLLVMMYRCEGKYPEYAKRVLGIRSKSGSYQVQNKSIRLLSMWDTSAYCDPLNRRCLAPAQPLAGTILKREVKSMFIV